MKLIGVILVILGIVSLLYGGIQYREHHTVLQVGDLKASTNEDKRFTIPPAVGVVLLVAGIGLVVMDTRGAGSGRT